MKSYYSVKEVAAILGYSTNSIYKFVNTGRLNNTRGNSLRGRFKITKKAMEQFLGHELTQEYIDSIINPAPPPKPPASPPKPNTPALQTPPRTSYPIPINLTRGLIIFSLVLVLADIFITQNFSFLPQLIRLVIIATLIAITYQFGQSPNQHQPA